MKERIEELAFGTAMVVHTQTRVSIVEVKIREAITTAVNEALEMAAKECEKRGIRICDNDDYWGPEYANRIRNLKVN